MNWEGSEFFKDSSGIKIYIYIYITHIYQTGLSFPNTHMKNQYELPS